MTGTTQPAAHGRRTRRSSSRAATPATNGTPVVPSGGSTEPGSAGTAQRHSARAAPAPITGRPHKPCSRPPKSRPAAYDRRPAAGPGRAPCRTQRRPVETRQVRVELPDEPPQLTPLAARALLRILLKAHAARHGEQGNPIVTDQPARP